MAPHWSNRMELIFIGASFYDKSQTIMSSLYDVEGNRQDWGFVRVALEKGQSVHIRPATSAEISHYTQKLANLLEELSNE